MIKGSNLDARLNLYRRDTRKKKLIKIVSMKKLVEKTEEADVCEIAVV